MRNGNNGFEAYKLRNGLKNDYFCMRSTYASRSECVPNVA